MLKNILMFGGCVAVGILVGAIVASSMAKKRHAEEIAKLTAAYKALQNLVKTGATTTTTESTDPNAGYNTTDNVAPERTAG
jgi:hypothetical protein